MEGRHILLHGTEDQLMGVCRKCGRVYWEDLGETLEGHKPECRGAPPPPIESPAARTKRILRETANDRKERDLARLRALRTKEVE